MKNDNESNDKAIIEYAERNPDGFTINANAKPLKFKRGFYVGLTNNSHADINTALQNLKQIKKMFKSVVYFGGWLDKKENLFYLDLSKRVGNKADALRLAKVFNQKAIWDISKSESIYL